jgi:Gas vesicle protein K
MSGDERILRGPPDALADFGRELERVRTLPRRLDADPESVGRGLAQLVLTLVDLLRQLMERQALRRVDDGTLSDAEIERLGLAFKALAERMEELKAEFGLEDEDLNMHLGPLGDLL